MLNRIGLTLICWLLPACGSTAVIDQSGETADSLTANDDGWYVVRPDLRKCASPMCGGYFVKSVNLTRTVCLDGRAHAECYVTALDWSATQFSDGERVKLAASPVILRGRLAQATGTAASFANLRVTEAWSPAVTPDVENGYPAFIARLYRAFDNGTRCISWPCPSITQEKLNSSQATPVADIDLSDSCADDKQIAAAYDALAGSTGVLVDGEDGWVNGPAGKMKELVGYDFYLRVEAAAPQPRSCGGFVNTRCDAGEYCDIAVANACNGADLPGVCKTVPEACMELYKPVCGCDGKTYSNDCFRIMAQEQLDHDGACSE